MTRAFLWILCAATVVAGAAPAEAQYGRYRPTTDPATGERYNVEVAYGLWNPSPDLQVSGEALGIQGTVVLEVEFTASNDIRVLRVIRKLGHGLDEAAIRAAEQIRFKPARRQGVAVDAVVTVQIEFHLT